MTGEKNNYENVQVKGCTSAAADLAAVKKARSEAVTWREIAARAAADHSKREGQFTRRLAELESQGALARGCLEAQNTAKAWEAAADKWEAGEHEQAENFEEEANTAMMESLDGLDKSDEL